MRKLKLWICYLLLIATDEERCEIGRHRWGNPKSAVWWDGSSGASGHYCKNCGERELI
jgi:hypothetical protein